LGVIQHKCKVLFEKDYVVGVVDNENGDLCNSYPLQLLVIEKEKNASASLPRVSADSAKGVNGQEAGNGGSHGQRHEGSDGEGTDYSLCVMVATQWYDDMYGAAIKVAACGELSEIDVQSLSINTASGNPGTSDGSGGPSSEEDDDDDSNNTQGTLRRF
jgi:hypothetical protein